MIRIVLFACAIVSFLNALIYFAGQVIPSYEPGFSDGVGVAAYVALAYMFISMANEA